MPVVGVVAQLLACSSLAAALSADLPVSVVVAVCASPSVALPVAVSAQVEAVEFLIPLEVESVQVQEEASVFDPESVAGMVESVVAVGASVVVGPAVLVLEAASELVVVVEVGKLLVDPSSAEIEGETLQSPACLVAVALKSMVARQTG